MKTLYAIVVCICLAPAALAAGYAFSECPDGYSCEETPRDAPFPPDAVTGHTVYARWVIERQDRASLGLPTDFAAIAGYFVLNTIDMEATQRECVTWFNGKDLDQRGDDVFGRRGGFPSDEDQRAPADEAEQDYSFDRDVRTCKPRAEGTIERSYAGFAVAVEAGDCAPHLGRDMRFRGHLDFVDPNGIYHEVQEYDYVCGGPLAERHADGIDPDLWYQLQRGPEAWVSDAVKDLFPQTWTDPHNEGGCDTHATPADNADPVNGSLGHFDLGHKCNGSVQELFTERLWITRIHERVWDATIQDHYNFALQVDTCSGINIYERDGKDGRNATQYPPDQDRERFGEVPGGPGAYDQAVGVLDAMARVAPLVDRCTDGSSWSFDDTPRGRTVHGGPPADEEDIMRGNSYDLNATSTTFGKHRQNCRMADMRWPENTHRPAPGNEECYPEDHKTARIDLYVYDLDPTRGLWYVNSNGMTGQNAYVAGVATGASGPNG